MSSAESVYLSSTKAIAGGSFDYYVNGPMGSAIILHPTGRASVVLVNGMEFGRCHAASDAGPTGSVENIGAAAIWAMVS